MNIFWDAFAAWFFKQNKNWCGTPEEPEETVWKLHLMHLDSQLGYSSSFPSLIKILSNVLQIIWLNLQMEIFPPWSKHYFWLVNISKCRVTKCYQIHDIFLFINVFCDFCLSCQKITSIFPLICPSWRMNKLKNLKNFLANWENTFTRKKEWSYFWEFSGKIYSVCKLQFFSAINDVNYTLRFFLLFFPPFISSRCELLRRKSKKAFESLREMHA